MGCAVNLIALGVGYMVFLSATKEKGGIRDFGRIVGIVIIIASIASGICGAMRCKYLKNACGMKSGMCPVMAKQKCPIGGMSGSAK